MFPAFRESCCVCYQEGSYRLLVSAKSGGVALESILVFVDT